MFENYQSIAIEEDVFEALSQKDILGQYTVTQPRRDRNPDLAIQTKELHLS